MMNAWPAIALFVLGTAGVMYLIRVGLALKGKQERGVNTNNGRIVASWKAHIAIAVALWLFLVLAEVYLFIVLSRAQP